MFKNHYPFTGSEEHNETKFIDMCKTRTNKKRAFLKSLRDFRGPEDPVKIHEEAACRENTNSHCFLSCSAVFFYSKVFTFQSSQEIYPGLPWPSNGEEGLCASKARGAGPLVRELRSHLLCSEVKKIKLKKHHHLKMEVK